MLIFCDPIDFSNISVYQDEVTDSSVKLVDNCNSSASTAYVSRKRRNFSRNRDLPQVTLDVEEIDVELMTTEEDSLLHLTSRCTNGSVKLLPYVMNDYEQAVDLTSDDGE